MKYINGLDSANAEATCPKDEMVAWSVPPKCDKVLVITVKSGIIRCYDEGGGIFSLPMPKVEPRQRRNCDRFHGENAVSDALCEFYKECSDNSRSALVKWMLANVAEGEEK